MLFWGFLWGFFSFLFCMCWWCRLAECFFNTIYISWRNLERKNVLEAKECIVLNFSSMHDTGAISKAFFFQFKSLKGLIGFTLRLFSSMCLICFPPWHSLFAPCLQCSWRAGWLTCDSQHDDVMLLKCPSVKKGPSWCCRSIYWTIRKMP